MSKQDFCVASNDFADAKEERANLLREARRIVLWAGSLTGPGEEIGGIGVQLARAANRLQLHQGVVDRAYARRSGPEIFPSIQEARNKLIERIAQEQAKAACSPWAGHIQGLPRQDTPRQAVHADALDTKRDAMPSPVPARSGHW